MNVEVFFQALLRDLGITGHSLIGCTMHQCAIVSAAGEGTGHPLSQSWTPSIACTLIQTTLSTKQSGSNGISTLASFTHTPSKVKIWNIQ